jgi:hypothetical protein
VLMVFFFNDTKIIESYILQPKQSRWLFFLLNVEHFVPIKFGLTPSFDNKLQL